MEDDTPFACGELGRTELAPTSTKNNTLLSAYTKSSCFLTANNSFTPEILPSSLHLFWSHFILCLGQRIQAYVSKDRKKLLVTQNRPQCTNKCETSYAWLKPFTNKPISSTSGAQPLAYRLNPTCRAMSSRQWISPWVWKISGGVVCGRGGRVVTVLITPRIIAINAGTAPLPPNFQTHGEPRVQMILLCMPDHASAQ